MDRFSNDRQALDFVTSRIADEAQRDGVPLSEVERKMLYFSETAWTLPDIWRVNDEFDRDYEQNAYERKISGLIKKAASRARKQSHKEFEDWTEAIRYLSKDDRYLNVMVGQAGARAAFRSPRQRRSLWKRWLAGCSLWALFGSLVWFINKLFPETNLPNGPRVGRLSVAFWAAMVSVAVCYGLLRLLIGVQRFDHIEGRVLKWFFGASRRSS